MKIRTKISGIAALFIGLMMTACDSDEPTYEPASAPNSDEVYFADDEITEFAIDRNATTQTLNLYRTNTEKASVAHLSISGDTEFFTISESVSFGEGVNVAPIEITPLVDNMADFTEYTITIEAVGDDMTSPWLNCQWTGKFTFANGEEWISIGECEFTSDIFEPDFNLPSLTWPVEVQAHYDTEGLYRLVCPYGCADSPFARYYDGGDDNYMYVNVQDPTKVILSIDNPNERFSTGLDLGYGVMSIGLQAYGTFSDGMVTFPVRGLIYIDNDGAYYANKNGAFCIDLSVLE